MSEKQGCLLFCPLFFFLKFGLESPEHWTKLEEVDEVVKKTKKKKTFKIQGNPLVH